MSTHEFDCECSRVRLQVLVSSNASARNFDCERSRVQLRVLASSIANACEFVCEYSRAFSSLTLASFDSRVGNASLTCARTRSCLVLACDIVSNTSHSHLFVKLHLSGTVSTQHYYWVDMMAPIVSTHHYC